MRVLSLPIHHLKMRGNGIYKTTAEYGLKQKINKQIISTGDFLHYGYTGFYITNIKALKYAEHALVNQ